MSNFNSLATNYSKTAIKVSSFAEVENVIDGKYNFEVKKLPLVGLDDMDSPATGFCGLFRDDNLHIVGDSSVSSKYVPHSRNDIKALVEASRQAFDGELSVDCFWRDAHVLVVMPTRDAVAKIGGRDTIIPRLSIYGGFAGKGFQASLGFYRVICNNLAILNQVGGVSANIRHTMGMRDKIDDLVTRFQEIKGSWDETVAAAEKMNEKKFVVRDFLADFFKSDDVKTERGRTRMLNIVDAVMTRIIREQTDLGTYDGLRTATGWQLFGAIHGYTQHEASRKEKDITLRGLDTWNDASIARLERMAMGVGA